MTRKIPLLALGFGMALASAQAFAHGNHSHGPALTEVERQASEGIFADKDVQNRALSDWEGVWQSVNPYLLNGDLDPVLEQKAKKPGGITTPGLIMFPQTSLYITVAFLSRLALKMT